MGRLITCHANSHVIGEVVMLRTAVLFCFVVATTIDSAEGASRRKRKKVRYRLGSVALDNAYRYEPKRADKRLRGKWIAVYGLVDRVAADENTVLLEIGEDVDRFIVCEFKKLPPEARNVQRNQKVTIEGTCAGMGANGPRLVDCEPARKAAKDISRLRPDLKLSVEGLCNEYRASPIKAKERYGEKILEISGIVESAHIERKGGRPVVRLRDPVETPDFYVLCYLEQTHIREIDELRKGAVCTVRGYCEGLIEPDERSTKVRRKKDDDGKEETVVETPLGRLILKDCTAWSSPKLKFPFTRR